MRLIDRLRWTVAMFIASTAQAQVSQLSTLLDNTGGYSAVAQSKDVADEVGALTLLSNKVFKPKGDGPFRAVVIVHSCGGVHRSHIRTHAQEFLEAGFVVLVQDSFTPRGTQNCREKRIPFATAVQDAYSGLAHLASLSFVRVGGIYLVGYSYGGGVASLASSARSASKFGSSRRFRGAASHYSNCFAPSGSALVLDDIDRPLLMLMGDRDTETPAANCNPRLQQLKDGGAPVSWHIFAGATHGWDRQGESQSGYVFDQQATTEATRRTIQFFRELE